jgi:hypothetical protein
MASQPAELSQIEIEKLLLRAMCQPGVRDSIWKIASGPLKTYHWREPVHEALFGALRDLRARKPALLRELLPAALTRRGFPDVAWENFFDTATLSDEEARLLLRRLLEPGGL